MLVVVLKAKHREKKAEQKAARKNKRGKKVKKKGAKPKGKAEPEQVAQHEAKHVVEPVDKQVAKHEAKHVVKPKAVAKHVVKPVAVAKQVAKHKAKQGGEHAQELAVVAVEQVGGLLMSRRHVYSRAYHQAEKAGVALGKVGDSLRAHCREAAQKAIKNM